MLDGITSQTGENSWHQIAGWVAGGALFVMVILLGVGVYRMIQGKTTSSSEDFRKGLTMAGLSLAGAIVLGSIGAAVSWSGSSQTQQLAGTGLSGLMPEGARPTSVPVERQGALASCPDYVSLGWDDDYTAEPELTADMGEALEGMGLLSRAQEDALQWAFFFDGTWDAEEYVQEHVDRSEENPFYEIPDGIQEAIDDPSAMEDFQEEFDAERERIEESIDITADGPLMIASVEWLPAVTGDSNSCDSSNHNASPGSTVTVTVTGFHEQIREEVELVQLGIPHDANHEIEISAPGSAD